MFFGFLLELSAVVLKERLMLRTDTENVHLWGNAHSSELGGLEAWSEQDGAIIGKADQELIKERIQGNVKQEAVERA